MSIINWGQYTSYVVITYMGEGVRSKNRHTGSHSTHDASKDGVGIRAIYCFVGHSAIYIDTIIYSM